MPRPKLPPAPPTRQEALRRSKLPWKRAHDLPHRKGISVSAIVDEYLKSQKYLSVSNKTKVRYMSALKFFDKLILYNNKTLFQMYVHKVDYSTVDYLHTLLTHYYLSASIRFNFIVMGLVWNHAMRNGRAVYNPWARPGVKVDNERDITWTPEEVKRGVETARLLGYNVLALYIIFGYETGIRMWSDLRRLKWDNIHREPDGRAILDFVVSKTGVHLCVPLSPVAVDVLNNLPDQVGPVFKTDRGVVPTAGAFFTQFQRVKVHGGLPMHLQLRDLRRTAVTELVVAGATDREIAAVTGWKNPGAVMNRYARIRLQSAENGMNKRWANREPNQDTPADSEAKCPT